MERERKRDRDVVEAINKIAGLIEGTPLPGCARFNVSSDPDDALFAST